MFAKTPHPETCDRCPMRDTGKPCPAYIGADAGFVEEKLGTSETRVVTGCFFQVIPKLMVHVVQAANRTSAVTQTVRNELASGIETLGRAVITGTELLLKAQPSSLQIEDKSDGKK